MLQGELEPFIGGHKISRVAFKSLADSPEIMFALSTIWGAFAEPMRFEEEAASAEAKEDRRGLSTAAIYGKTRR